MPQVNLMAMQEKLTDLGNAIIDRLQINDAHNNLILASSRESQPHDHRPVLPGRGDSGRVLLPDQTPVGSRENRSDIPPPPAVAAASTGPPGVLRPGGRRNFSRRDNLLEPVRELVRDFFASIGLQSEIGRPHAKGCDERHGCREEPNSLRAAIKDFWKIAYGPPQALSVSRWRELEPFFERLREGSCQRASGSSSSAASTASSAESPA